MFMSSFLSPSLTFWSVYQSQVFITYRINHSSLFGISQVIKVLQHWRQTNGPADTQETGGGACQDTFSVTLVNMFIQVCLNEADTVKLSSILLY